MTSPHGLTTTWSRPGSAGRQRPCGGGAGEASAGRGGAAGDGTRGGRTSGARVGRALGRVERAARRGGGVVGTRRGEASATRRHVRPAIDAARRGPTPAEAWSGPPPRDRAAAASRRGGAGLREHAGRPRAAATSGDGEQPGLTAPRGARAAIGRARRASARCSTSVGRPAAGAGSASAPRAGPPPRRARWRTGPPDPWPGSGAAPASARRDARRLRPIQRRRVVAGASGWSRSASRRGTARWPVKIS